METLHIADKQKNPQDSFWSKSPLPFIADSSPQMQGSLWVLKRGCHAKRYFVLHKTVFYQFSKKSSDSPSKWVNVSWKVFELISGGFKLGSEEFLSDKKLDDWKQAFSKVCFVRGFAEDFTITDQIGQGAYAKVYSVRHKISGEIYAAKAVEMPLLSERSLLALKSEIKTMRRINHPSLVKAHWIYQEETQVIFIMDLMSGGDLFKMIIKFTRIPENLVCTFAAEMLEGLAYLQEKEIVHRDIKPENIFLKQSDNLNEFKLGDFGFVCKASKKPTLSCGSPGYVAPEVLMKQQYDCKADMFGLGIIIYIMLTGSTPFGGTNQREILSKNRSCQIAFHAAQWKRLSPQAKDFVMLLTEKNTQLRPTAKEALKHPWVLADGTPTGTSNKIDQFKRFKTADFSGDSTASSSPEKLSCFSNVADGIKKFLIKNKQRK